MPASRDRRGREIPKPTLARVLRRTAIFAPIRNLGVKIAIDDFGTGYSSLVYLKRLPIDTLKIDKEFIGDLTRDPDDEAITSTIITMGHSLGLNVIAEGVETEEQLMYLREQGCDEIQGFWLSPPLDAQRCLTFIRSWQPSAVAAMAVRSFRVFIVVPSTTDRAVYRLNRSHPGLMR